VIRRQERGDVRHLRDGQLAAKRAAGRHLGQHLLQRHAQPLGRPGPDVAEALAVSVVNDPAPEGAAATPADADAGTAATAAAGHGLLGMRERVAMLAGVLDAGPRPDGGYAVVAVLPTTGDGGQR
jgi:hypothetical protein